MVVATPPAAVIAAFSAPTTQHYRRVEIYEKDGVTRWSKDVIPRLVDGSVTLDYGREEQRHFDLALSNDDGMLRNEPGEFWYDKIIKIFRGVKLPASRSTVPSVLVHLGEAGSNPAAESDAVRSALSSFGFVDTSISFDDFGPHASMDRFDVIIMLSSDPEVKQAVQSYALAGGSVFVDMAQAASFVGLVAADDEIGPSRESVTSDYTIYSVPGSLHPGADGWSSFTSGRDWEVGLTPALMRSFGFQSVGLTDAYPTDPYIASAEAVWAGGRESTGARLGVFLGSVTRGSWSDAGFKNFIASMVRWLGEDLTLGEWEVQVGEFMIDRISENNFPPQVAITGRDYTKKCLAAKFEASTQFNPPQNLELLIRNLAANSGVTKFNLPPTGIIVTKTFYYERGTTRWEAMKEIATAYGYDVYFDAMGFLRLRLQQDPTLGAPSFVVKGGADGTMSAYAKSTADTRIYNHIVVTGESSDEAVLPVYAVSRNDNPASPTSTVNLGVRTYTYTSSFIATYEQAKAVADNFLTLHALEEYELGFDILMAPWLEVGDVVQWVDPRPASDDPDRYLLTALTIPLGLGTMAGTGKRVIKVVQ